MKIEFLRAFGLTNSEINVYLTMLPLGPVEAKEVYKRSKVPFGKIYNVLYSLDRKGLVNVQYTRPKVFQAVSPDLAVKNLLNQKDKELCELSEKANDVKIELDKLCSEKDEQSPFWTVMMNREPSTYLLERVFNETEKEVLIYLDKPPNLNVSGKKRTKEYYLELEPIIHPLGNIFEKGIKVKVLLYGNANDFPNMRKALHNLKANKLLDLRLTKVQSSPFIIIDGKKVIFAIWDPLSDENDIIASIYLWNVALARKLKEGYDVLWEDSEEVNR